MPGSAQFCRQLHHRKTERAKPWLPQPPPPPPELFAPRAHPPTSLVSSPAAIVVEVPSVTSLWRSADWHEREVYDLSGVWFIGHPNLTRILLSEDWVGHPLRKDYEFPLEYHGIRGR